MILNDENISALVTDSDLWVETGSRDRQVEITQSMAREIKVLREVEVAARDSFALLRVAGKLSLFKALLDDALAKYKALKEEA